MGFSVKPAVVVLLIGAVLVAAFSLHRLKDHNRICHYRNWDAPCRTTGLPADWTDLSAVAVVLGAAIAAGAIGGSRKWNASAAKRGELPKVGTARQRHVDDQLHRHYRKAPGNLAQSIFLATMNTVMQAGTPRLEAEHKVVESLRETYPDFTPLRQ